MKKEMKVSPFFDREYLKRAETREDRERLLQNIEWVSMVPAEEFLANLANIWLEMEDIYMEEKIIIQHIKVRIISSRYFNMRKQILKIMPIEPATGRFLRMLWQLKYSF